ncbi:MAG: hypothetical protein GEU82_05455 [Luteitalea sp.]|nr:hypothetical protein [Luteitalea sp.]
MVRLPVAAPAGGPTSTPGLNFVTFGLLYQPVAGSAGGFLAGRLVYALTNALRVVNITRGNLGINEWIVAIVGKALAFEVTAGLALRSSSGASRSPGKGSACLSGGSWLGLRTKP